MQPGSRRAYKADKWSNKDAPDKNLHSACPAAYRSTLWRPLRTELVDRCTAAGPAGAGCCPGCGRAQRRRQAPWQAV